MKRSPLRRRSPLRARRRTPAEKQQRAEVRQIVFDRDGRCRMRNDYNADRCFGSMTVHHLQKASAGGTYEPANLIMLCAYHNGWVEDHPRLAWEMGLVCRSGDTLPETWGRMLEWHLIDKIPPCVS